MKVALTTMVVFLMFQGMAQPCEGPPIPPSSSFSVDTTIQDEEPPGAVEIVEWRIEREPGDEKYEPDSCGTRPRCMPEASIGFHVLPEQDQDVLGYIVNPVGENNCGCRTCSEPIRSENGWIWISKTYSAGKDIECEFEVLAVDPAGNEGPSSIVNVFDPGDGDGGCSSRPGGTFSVLGLLAVTLLFVKIKRRSKILSEG